MKKNKHISTNTMFFVFYAQFLPKILVTVQFKIPAYTDIALRLRPFGVAQDFLLIEYDFIFC